MLNRRRFLSVIASGAALSALSRESAAAVPEPVMWNGVAMGAAASMTLVDEDRTRCLRLIERCLAEIDRLENIFSLYRSGSALSRLNAEGMLDVPPTELVEVLSMALELSRASRGVFDPSIQPLYRLYADHFQVHGAAASGPSAGRIAEAKALVDWRKVHIDSGRIMLGQPGMALTLNSVAQGYVTDCVAALLREEGLGNVLLDLGEIVGMGHHPLGRPWLAAVSDPRDPQRSILDVELRDAGGGLPALATSAGYGTRFEPSGRFDHLIDPHTGASTHHHAAVTVAAPRAVIADALSTALYLMPLDEAAAVLHDYAPATAYFVDDSGAAVRRDA